MCTVIASPSSSPTAQCSSGDSFASAKLQKSKGRSQISVEHQVASPGIPALVAKKLRESNHRHLQESDRACLDKVFPFNCTGRFALSSTQTLARYFFFV